MAIEHQFIQESEQMLTFAHSAHFAGFTVFSISKGVGIIENDSFPTASSSFSR
jgi:hypothetical protein